jgi:hypothetical protein
MTLTRITKRLLLPAGHYVEAAVALQVSKHLRERLRAASVVIALWPNGSQDVVWGGDDLTRARALGRRTAQILLLRVSDDDDCRFLDRMVHCLKEQPPASLASK